MPIDVQSLAIPEVKLITPQILRDPRGFFSETYNREALAAAGIDATFVQDNHSLSRAKGVIRGIDDPDLGIDWRVAPGEAVLSDKDRRLPRLSGLPPAFNYRAP